MIALSLSSSLTTLGAIAAFAALLGIAVLSLLVFSQAREIKRLREWAGRAPERAAEMEQRVSAQAAARVQREPAPGGAVRVTPRTTPLVSAPVSSAVQASAAAATGSHPLARGSSGAPGAPVGAKQAISPDAQQAPSPDASAATTPSPDMSATTTPSSDVSAATTPSPGVSAATAHASGADASASEATMISSPGQPEGADEPSPAGAPPAAPSPEGLIAPIEPDESRVAVRQEGGSDASETAEEAEERDGEDSGDATPAPATAAALAARAPLPPAPARQAPSRPQVPAVPAVPLRSSEPLPRSDLRRATKLPPAPPASGRRAPSRTAGPGRTAAAGQAPRRRGGQGGGSPTYYKQRRSPVRATALIVGAAIAGVLVIVLAVSALKGSSPASPSGAASSPLVQTTSSHASARHERAQAASNPAEVAVSVLNGTSTAGLAHHLAADLQQTGYDRAEASSAVPSGSHAKTVVEYTSGHRADAQAVAKSLNVTDVQSIDSSTAQLAPSATVVVLAGADQAALLGGGGTHSQGEPAAETGAGEAATGATP